MTKPETPGPHQAEKSKDQCVSKGGRAAEGGGGRDLGRRVTPLATFLENKIGGQGDRRRRSTEHSLEGEGLLGALEVKLRGTRTKGGRTQPWRGPPGVNPKGQKFKPHSNNPRNKTNP